MLFLKGCNVDGVMSELVNYKRSPDCVSEGFSDTVSETSEISGKSYPALFRGAIRIIERLDK